MGRGQVANGGPRSRRHGASASPHHRQQRRQNKRLRSQDPLTILLTLFTFPLLVVALVGMHVVYYLSIKARARYDRQRQIAGRMVWPGEVMNGVRDILVSSEADMVDSRHDRLAQLRLANGWGQATPGIKGTNGMVPRHLALALGPKPIRTRTLLWHAMLQPWRLWSRSTDPQERFGQRGRKGSDIHALSREESWWWPNPTKEQQTFLRANLRSAMHLCALCGIEQLTIYDEQGYLSQWLAEVELNQQDRVDREASVESHWNELATLMTTLKVTATFQRPFYAPVTLPSMPSCKTNGGLVNGHHDRPARSLCIHILGHQDAHQSLAKAATLLQQRRSKGVDLATIDEQRIRDVLQGNGYPSDPDLLLIHGGPRQVSTLHGFPPLLLRLCEIYHDHDAAPYDALTATSFERGLLAYVRSEQRFGK